MRIDQPHVQSINDTSNLQARYPPTTGKGRYETKSANRNLPMIIKTMPVENVAMVRRTKHVDMTSSCVPPLEVILLAIVFKIRS